MKALLPHFVGWLLAPARLLPICLCAAILASAVAVAYSVHLTRARYHQLQLLEKTRDQQEHERAQLLLEQGAWSDYSRLRQLAEQQLSMVAPAPRQVVVISEAAQ